MPDALIIGAAIADIPLSPVGPEVFGAPSTSLERVAMQVGGDAANEAMVLARLGHAPALISLVGRDAPGDWVLNALARAGVDTRCVTRQAGLDTGLNVVLVDSAGERRFITSSAGSLRKLALSHILPALDDPALSGVRIACLASLFVSFQLPLEDIEALLDALKARGLILCADTTRPKRGETLREARGALSRLDWFFPNLDEALALTGAREADAAAEALLGCGVKHVVLKLGGRGCLLADGDGRRVVPAVQGVKCVDTTGAGDTFAAAFIAALLEGRAPEECARFANAAASLCVQSVGAAGGTWTRADADARFNAL